MASAGFVVGAPRGAAPVTNERAVWERVLDRELLLSAFSHDVRGPITALSGYAELEGVSERSPLRLATARLVELVGLLPGRVRAEVPTDLGPLFGVDSAWGRTSGCVEPLAFALTTLPHGACELEESASLWTILVPGLPAEELTVDWSVHLVRRWETEPGVGRAGARLRMAARLAGAARVGFRAEEGAAHGVLRIAFGRAPA